MRHDIHLTGHAFTLRAIELGDASLIVNLRSDAERNRYLHRISLDVSDQTDYLAGYLTRGDDYYFVVDRVGPAPHPEGLIAIYDVDSEHSRAEWGRWVIAEGSLAAVESAWLIYRVGFERLGLDEVYCRTLTENARTIAFHDRTGLERRGELDEPYEIDGREFAVTEHYLTRERWPEASARLERQAERLASRLTEAR
jgi:RimJ/RimL family protein N-acetyltransferase